ncbi:hypothetical protein [Streptomyces rubrogriseus]|uniref:hypothetical protein n=1 Tax=Streptomyces rubrogriseus TaxID=194673 RepID=UPI0037D1A4A3
MRKPLSAARSPAAAVSPIPPVFAAFGADGEDRTLLSAFTVEEERAASTIVSEPLKRGTRGEVHILDMIASVKVEVTRPSEKTASFLPFTGRQRSTLPWVAAFVPLLDDHRDSVSAASSNRST